MSFSSSPPPHPRFTTPFPAVASSELPSDVYHDTAESKPNRRTGEVHEVSQVPVNDFASEEAAERQQRRQRRGSLWTRGIAVVSPIFAYSGRKKIPEASVPLLPLHTDYPKLQPRWLRKPTRSCCFLYSTVGFFVMLDILQFFFLACGIIISFFPDEIDRVTDHWREPQSLDPSDSTRWPTEISRDIIPVGCHSHNDYWRRVPLYSALEAGCTGVEADVWLFDDELFVGHSISSLTPSRTLRSLYIDPLMRILRRQNPVTHLHPELDETRNGVFDTNPLQPLILLIDFKTDGEESWDFVYSQLTPLRESGYLTYYNGSDIVNGPVTVVGTGNAPFDRIAANMNYRDIFFDAPLDRLVDNIDRIDAGVSGEEYAENPDQDSSDISNDDNEPDTFDTTNSYYASVSFKKAVGTPWALHLTDRQVQTIRSQVRAAHRHGLKARYWDTPDWPRSLRNHIWRVLVREGVDMLNVDDLVSATRKEWVPRISDSWH
ncbi:PLC-like phosphodiesterase [Aspergillus aurantiobrunneus]